ncbi:hypothetical protein [Longitalea luteola]|uniref:hypothetical protein n=1 Tax=Longitalea luteola TaxID=2812563 RepID=UPI001A95BFA0|nr:hypothetical protein [Longitalea luteola]
MNSQNAENAAIISNCVAFLHRIGIPTLFKKIETDSFLPGLSIENGHVVIDTDALLYPGDILHEAGHIAVVAPASRLTLNQHDINNSPMREAEEMMAIAWSYAACLHLQFDPHLVFHDAGYQAGGSNIVENFREGRYFGTPMLQYYKMTIEPAHAQPGDPVYPHMLQWLREA